MTHRAGYVAFIMAIASAGIAVVFRRLGPVGPTITGVPASAIAIKVLLAAAVLFGTYGAYVFIARTITRRDLSKRRIHTTRNVLRLVFVLISVIGVLAVITEQWVGLLFSLGILGFAVTFALQQPLLSLLGWVYIVTKQPYQVGDRVMIEGAKGDVIDVDYLVTTLWEIDGDLVSANQPSGRIVTVPNSVALSNQVYNYSWGEFPFIWNELLVQVAYETDLGFARETMRDVADDYLGDEMEHRVERYREILGQTPVELEVRDRPSVNIRQAESWVELRLRYLIHPREGARVRNELYERILTEFNNHPEQVKFPIGRNR